jgi:tRNA A37 threonylcarbamoyladenosine synthetase subunit TsaC/SUA5/YrdC
MCPLFQTSANVSGKPAPSSFADVPAAVAAAADLAIDGGALTGKPSTVVDLTRFDAGGEWSVLREGGLSRGELAARLTAIGEADAAGG